MDDEELSSLVRLALPHSAEEERSLARTQLRGINEIQALTLLSRAPNLAEACRWWTQLGPRGNEWPPLVAPSQRWEEYCERVAAAAGEDTQRAAGVFGSCVRCGSQRLLVTTKQLRRACGAVRHAYRSEPGRRDDPRDRMVHMRPRPRSCAPARTVATPPASTRERSKCDRVECGHHTTRHHESFFPCLSAALL